MCDNGAGASYYSTAPEVTELMLISPALYPKANLRALQQAFTVGRQVKNVETCRQVYSLCPYSGAEMDKFIIKGKV